MPQEETGTWDFHKLSVRNRIQSEILENIPEDLRAEWAAKNGEKIAKIIDQDPAFQELVDRRDWEGAKKLITDRVPLPKQRAVKSESSEKAA